jgi:hypothetical protein
MKEQALMKKVKTIVKTLLFSTLMAVVISTAGYKVSPERDLTENVVAVCCSEYPDSESNMTGY